MEHDLVGYVLKALDPTEQRQVEAFLRSHPAAQSRLEALQRTLAPLANDPAEAPPADLTTRTLAAAALLPLSIAEPLSRAWWPTRRLVECAIAAAAVLLVAGGLMTWIARLGQSKTGGDANAPQIVECKHNLHRLFAALKTYSEQHGGNLPNVAAAAPAPRNIGPMVYPLLYDAKLLPADGCYQCPAVAGAPGSMQSVKEITALPNPSFQAWATKAQSWYSYSLGYVSNGQPVGLRFDKCQPVSLIPLMADSSPLNAKFGNSPNHGSKGQNVLYCDGHVTFFPARNVGFGQDDIYLNRKGNVAAGLDAMDTVLSSSAATP